MICLTSCSNHNQKINIVDSDPINSQQIIKNFPKVDLRISVKDTLMKYGDKVLLDISLRNNGDEDQKVLFDKPKVSTGGPWATIGKVTDNKTKKSVLKYGNKAMLSSQFYTEEELKDKYYNLKPGQSIKRQYELNDIVIIDNSTNSLESGIYEVQLFYYNNPSNIIKVKIQ